MTKLSVNINKVATLRNTRLGNTPNIVQIAKDCESFGAEGITVHPRPDQRHIRYQDVLDLKPVLRTEFNIEGNPTPEFLKLVKMVKPHQVTLVPDAPDALTSNAGWDCVAHKNFLVPIISDLKDLGIRVSVFIEPDEEQALAAAKCGADRVELYTEHYARDYFKNPEAAVKSYVDAANAAKKCGMMVNAGHDLNLDNLNFLVKNIPFLAEVSIGHYLISDALYFGIASTIKKYREALKV